MKENQPESLYTSPSTKGKLFRFLGELAITDYEPNCVVHSRKEIQSLGEGLTYPFDKYSICKAFTNLGFSLKKNLESFDTIICEGVGGVLVSQVFCGLVSRVRGVGRGQASILYLASGQDSKAYPAIEELLAKKSSELGKTLTCTDFTFSGTSLTHIISFLDNLGAEYEVAILEDATWGEIKKKVNGKVHIGMYHTTQPRPATENINTPSLNGFYRDRNQTMALLKEFDGGLATQKTRESLGVFTDRLARLLSIPWQQIPRLSL